MPNLTDLKLLEMDPNEEFCSTLKAKASSIQVQTLEHHYIQFPTSASSHHIGEALCSMPNLTDLKLVLMDLNEEFCSTFKAKASSMQVQTLKLHYIQCPTQASSHHLAEALCSMPNLTDLTLNGIEQNEEFYSTLKAKASSIKVQTLELYHLQCPTSASSHHLAEAMCSMPNLTDLTLVLIDLNEEFCSTLKAKASSMQIQTLGLYNVQSPTPASLRHLVEALCYMPNLTDLTLGKNLNEVIYSTLKAKASSIQVQTLKLHNIQCPTPASSHHLAEALISMPNLTDLILRGIELEEEFYSTLKAKASIKVRTVKLEFIHCPTPASSHHLAEALCSMPNLTDLNLVGMAPNEEFCSTLKAKASSIQGCFPQIKKGNFKFNGVAQDDLNSFLHTLSCLQSSDLDGSANSGNSEGSRSRSRPCKRRTPCTESSVPQDDPGIPEKKSKYEV